METRNDIRGKVAFITGGGAAEWKSGFADWLHLMPGSTDLDSITHQIPSRHEALTAPCRYATSINTSH